MLILLIAILIVLLFVLIKFVYDEDKQFWLGIGWSLCAAACIIALFINCAFLTSGLTIPDKISMYEAENTQIDSQIYEIVKDYKLYEKETFDSIKDKSADVLVELYPDLKPSELISKQMDIYINNKNKIISLREDLIEQKIAKWWVYFGS